MLWKMRDEASARLVAGALVIGLAGAAGMALAQGACAQEIARAATAATAPVNDGLPLPGFEITPGATAIVITDPQNDFLSPQGATWGVVGESVTANGTVENLEALFRVAQETNTPVFVSPHYYYPHDHAWGFEGALETVMHGLGMFDRPDPLTLAGFEGSGADWLARYKPWIAGPGVVVTSPHKVYGPESNDLALQLRKAGISKVILGGMSSNLCTESHMRALVEAGFEVMVATDATAGAITEHYDGYAASLTNFRMIASDVAPTADVVARLRAAHGL